MKLGSLVLPLASLFLAAPALALQQAEAEIVDGTFSIVGRDPANGDLGIAVQSRTIAVGSRTRGGKGGVAVFAHQAASNPMYSILGVELIQMGMSPEQALEFMLLILRPLGLQNFSDVWLDLRVDEHQTPIAELHRILTLRMGARP